MKKRTYKTIHVFFLFLIAIIIVAAIYTINNLALTNFEELLFCYSSDLSNADYSSFYNALKICLPAIFVLTVVFYFLFYGVTNIELNHWKILKHINMNKKIYTIVLFIISLILLCYSIHIFEYLININSNSDFIEEHYINPKETNINFEHKNNLILIYVESLENTLFTKEQGGNWDYEVIPELYNLYQNENYLSFNLSKGMKMIHGASWTTASVITNTTGVPFKLSKDKQSYTTNPMAGTYALGDLLKQNGYYNEVISAANTTFGNLKYYFKNHGDFEIIDIDSIDEYSLTMEDEDKGNWGFNDNYLFNVAKERLNIISQKEEPFNLQLLTIDTHFFDGFIGNYSENKFDAQYENAYATESKLIGNFVNWVKEQPFYQNTTIVIIGDHLTMQSKFINNNMFKNRSVYSVIINPYNKQTVSRDRLFTALDTYPTIISALGGNIEGDKLGLGVNLFSGKKTLVEEYGLDMVDKELQKKSSFYNLKILNIK